MEDDECETSPNQILLVAQVLIRRDKDIIPRALSGIQQGTIRQSRPSLLINRRNSVSDKLSAQWDGRPLIEDNLHVDTAAVRVSTS